MIRTEKIKKNFLIYLVFTYLIFTVGFLSFQHATINNDFLAKHNEKNQYITTITQNLLDSLKKDVYLKMSFLVNDEEITKAFFEKDREKTYTLVKEYYKRQKVLNPYLKIMTFRNIDDSTFLRVHLPESYGDKINEKRKIIRDTNQFKKINYGFEVGKLKMAYRVVVPIFYKSQHIGLIEVGIEPEYLIDKLTASFDLKSALLIKKENLSISTTQNNKDVKIIDDFAMVRGDDFFQTNLTTINLKEPILDFIQYNGDSYLLETNLNLLDYKGDIAAKLLFASKVTDFDKRDRLILISFFFITIFFILLFFIIQFIIHNFIRLQNEQISIIEMQATKIQAIFDGASNIIVLTNGKKLIDANKAFLDFFTIYPTIADFKNDYDCICDKFEKYDGKDYLYEKMIDGDTWAKYIFNHPNTIHKTVISKNNQPHHFIVKVNQVEYANEILQVIDFSDITNEFLQQMEIKQQSALILTQTKMASLGEMIGNIAHQWRQPLSVISTLASGTIIQDELGLLTKKLMYSNLNTIVNTTQFLSQTIDDFRDFVKGEKLFEKFNIKNALDKSITIVEASLKNNDILIIKNIQEVTISTYQNELIQAINNILNNSKDALVSNNIEDKYLWIETFATKNGVTIKFKDNAGGIPEDIIGKIFDPYFTTKHKTQGTGLGLYMTHRIIEESLKGDIEATNETFTYEGKEYIGACFTIKLPFALPK
jgi:signal transduction histidine kinase